ncbi:hypothetical protein ACJJTC_003736 [Scirpophaga incertulas]
MPNTIEKADTSKNKEMLKDLKTKRSSIKGQITKFKKYLNIISQKLELSNIELVELNLKLSKFEALSVKFDDLQNEIEVLNSENIDAEIDEREGIDSDILSYLAAAKTLYQQHSQSETDLRRASVGHEGLCTHDHQEVIPLVIVIWGLAGNAKKGITASFTVQLIKQPTVAIMWFARQVMW